MVRNPECRDCQLGEQDWLITRCIPARLASEEVPIEDGVRVEYLLVGEAPGATEDELGVPFMGASGGLLQKALDILAKDEGLDLRRVGITNSVRCRPADNKNPPIKAKRECLKYLEAEVATLKPDVIVALGAQAASALTKGEVSSVGPNRLKVFDFEGVPLVVTFHPAAMLYDRRKVQDFLDDLHAYLVKRIWEAEPEDEVAVRLVNTMEGFEKLKLKLAGESRLGFDIETQGFTPHILTIAIALEDGPAYVLPVYHPESRLRGEQVKQWVVEHLVMNDRVTLVGQNIKYDLSMMVRSVGRGDEPIRCLTEDSMLYHHMLNEHSTSRNLDYLSRAYSKMGGYKEEVNHGDLTSEPLTSVARYNGRDAALPFSIITQITKKLNGYGYRSRQMETFYSRLTPFVATMEAAGVKVDLPTLDAVELELEKEIEELRTVTEEMAPGVNLDSPKQLSDFIYGELGLEVPDVKDAITGTGQKSTREDVLSHLSHPFVDSLLSYRGTAKLLRTYVGGIRDNLWPNSFVHPQFFIAKTDFGGTVTGRLSCKRPAMQTIPRGSSIRSVFVPRRANGTLLEFDAAQAELRVAAHFSRDRNLISLFQSGEDLHQATANLCGVDRQTGKTINFASIYGVTWWGLVEKAGLSETVARRVAKTLKREWAGLYSYFDQVKQRATLSGEVSTEYGRWRRVPGANPSDPRGRMLLREAANFVIQSAASDFVQTFGYFVSQRLSGLAVPIMSNHDGLYFDVFDKDKLQDVVDILLTEMGNFSTIIQDVFNVDLSVPFEWDIKVGPNLFEMKEIT